MWLCSGQKYIRQNDRTDIVTPLYNSVFTDCYETKCTRLNKVKIIKNVVKRASNVFIAYLKVPSISVNNF